MAKFNVYVPDELRARMGPDVNWSKVASAAFESHLLAMKEEVHRAARFHNYYEGLFNHAEQATTRSDPSAAV